MTTRELRFAVYLRASPAHVFDAFMDGRRHATITGLPARIENRVGGRFWTCGDDNHGIHLVLQPGRRIVQAWTQKYFAPRHTIIDIRLRRSGKGTRLDFLQTGVPPAAMAWLEPGWPSTYWEPMKRYFAARR
jgi:uncharacterized protein YndB with AHSA1/START domain